MHTCTVQYYMDWVCLITRSLSHRTVEGNTCMNSELEANELDGASTALRQYPEASCCMLLSWENYVACRISSEIMKTKG